MDYAIISDGSVIEVRSYPAALTDDMIKKGDDGLPLARPIRDVLPELVGNQQPINPSFEITDDEVVRTWQASIPSDDEVDLERDRRTEAGFMFGGVLFQARQEDRENIAGSGILAAVAVMMNGAQAGDLRWHGGDTDFVWIAADNSLVPMDAPTVIAFGKAAAEWKSAHIFAARSLKDTSPIPADYTNNGYWPS